METVFTIPPSEVGLGIDAHIARKLAHVLTDTEIELCGLANEPGYKKPDYSDWSEDDLYDYGRWLDALVSIEALESTDFRTGATREHYTRATKLHLGPSEDVITRMLKLKNFSDFKHNLGHRVQAEFSRMDEDQLLTLSLGLVDVIKRRPVTGDINEWYERGLVPSERTFKRTFGSLGAWQELLGYWPMRHKGPSDLADWGAAYYQTQPDEEISPTVLRRLSPSGRAPSVKAAYTAFPLGMESFCETARERNRELNVALESSRVPIDKEMHLSMSEGSVPKILTEAITNSVEPRERTELYARYMLLLAVRNGFGPSEKALSAIELSNEEIIGYLATDTGLPCKDFERIATQIGVYDVLWPRYRFQSIDFDWKKST